ncbi:MAG: transporter [Paenibacillaceae bacterium]|jgi:drug/metabolite transporter (DMT)-like permease|nr:transporter [Paenibacillaceae bacterium]
MIALGFIIMCLIFGTTFLAIKIGIDAGLAPFYSASIRFITAGGILFLYSLWKKKAVLSLLWRKETLLTGFLVTFGTFSTLYWAEQHISSGLAAVLSATGPIMILLLQTAYTRRRAHFTSAAGCAIGFAGVFVLMLPGLQLDFSSMWLAGCLVVLLGEVCYSGGALYSKSVMDRQPEASPLALNAAQMLFGGILLLVLSLFVEQPRPGQIFSLPALGSILYLTVAGSMIGHSLFYWLNAKTNPVFPSTWLYISPLIAMGLGSAVYGEAFSWISAAGALIILTGIILVNLRSLQALLRGRKQTASVPLQGKAESA